MINEIIMTISSLLLIDIYSISLFQNKDTFGVLLILLGFGVSHIECGS